MAEVERVDLSNLVTVFVNTVGYPTFENCIQHLQRQNCSFQLNVIDHVAPMSAAFQRMLDECTTPYFVQVDEDMLLYPHAVQSLYRCICAADENVAQFVCALYDVYLDQVIYGLKINRTEIVRRYPFGDVDGCEWDQVRRWRRDGFIDIRVPIEGATRDSAQTLGLHGTYWTPQSIYIRYSMLERRRRKGNKTHDWVLQTSMDLLKKYLQEPSELDFFALMGVLAGSLSDHQRVGHERDYRNYGETPGFKALCQFVDEVKKGWTEGDMLQPGEYDIDVLPYS
ncbi:MAG: hypothetical protein OEU36_11540 [Gammaproteobacteria bacterium]|nr:hypothetical protein [Gammaproteobacteria bacterium]